MSSNRITYDECSMKQENIDNEKQFDYVMCRTKYMHTTRSPATNVESNLIGITKPVTKCLGGEDCKKGSNPLNRVKIDDEYNYMNKQMVYPTPNTGKLCTIL